MKKTKKYLLGGLMLIAVLGGLSRHVAQAQLDPGARLYLIERGSSGIDHTVGEVYVHDRTPDQTQYVEDWVLYPNYQYPGPQFMGMLNITPSPMERPYASQSDFFRNVPFSAKSKYVRVTAQEFTSLPVAR
jgi:hypothetical protein